MTTQKPAQDERAPLNFSFPEDEPELTREAKQEKLREINEKGGWNRATRRAPANSEAAVSPKPAAQQKRTRRRRQKTGRTFPFSTKIKEETYDTILSLADKATEKEHRPVSLAEIIERAVENLEKADI